MRNLLYKVKVFVHELFFYPLLVGEVVDYENYWQEKKKGSLGVPNSFQRLRGEWIASRIQKNATLVDIGCGDGSVLFAIQKIKPINAIGLDVSKTMLHFLSTKGIQAQYLNLNDPQALDQLPSCDHALMLEVLEHMPKPEDFLLQTLSRVGNSVFVSVPNTGYIHHRLRLLLGRFPLQWRTHPSEHLRFWTLTDFKWWLKALNLADRATIHCYAGIPLLNRIWPSIFAQGLLVEIKTKEEK